MSARSVACLGGALIAGGGLFGAPSLYPAGIALALLPALAFAWVRLAVLGAGIGRELPGGSLLEGDHRVEWVPRGGLVPAPAAELRDPLLADAVPLRLSRRSRPIRRPVAFRRRGRIRLEPAELVVRDPFGLCERRVRGERSSEIIVLPRTERLEFSSRGSGGSALGAGAHGAGGSGPDSWAAEFEIDGLRPYREGSPAARIHWPTVARTGELHERRITSGADSARLVVLDPSRPAGDSHLDDAVRAAASICHALGAAGGCGLLIGGDPRLIEIEPGLRNFAAAHHRLALLEADAGPPAIHRIGRAGIVLWISADPSRRPEAALRRIPASRRIMVQPGAASRPGATTPSGLLFRVGGCEARELRTAARRGVAA